MKRCALILYIITLTLFISGCREVNISSENQLTATSWFCKNDVTSAELYFNSDIREANLMITDEKGEKSQIKGVYAVNDSDFIITSYDHNISYCFRYKVYEDRLELSYEEKTILMYMKK